LTGKNKLKYLYGNLGDIDLLGHEQKPTLTERQHRLHSELTNAYSLFYVPLRNISHIYGEVNITGEGLKNLGVQGL
jgi:hypothetical protein